MALYNYKLWPFKVLEIPPPSDSIRTSDLQIYKHKDNLKERDELELSKRIITAAVNKLSYSTYSMFTSPRDKYTGTVYNVRTV